MLIQEISALCLFLSVFFFPFSEKVWLSLVPPEEMGCPLQATSLDTPELSAPVHYFGSRGGHHLVTLEPSFPWYILLGESSLEQESF